MLWVLGQHSLHDFPVQLLDQRLEKASLFPLFDGEGVTRSLMLTYRDSSDILLVPYRPGIFRRRLFGPNRMSLKRSDLRNSRFEDAELVAALWHFDPWWELAEDRYAHHPAVPTLRSTNIVGFEKSLSRIWFDSGLSQARLVAIRAGESRRLKGFSPGLLEDAERKRVATTSEQAASGKPRSEWKLRPFWETGQ